MALMHLMRISHSVHFSCCCTKGSSSDYEGDVRIYLTYGICGQLHYFSIEDYATESRFVNILRNISRAFHTSLPAPAATLSETAIGYSNVKGVYSECIWH